MAYRVLHFVMWWIVRPIITPFVRWRHRAHQPPKGTRPDVRLTFDAVTYDVTETLIRAPDTEEGLAIWIVTGPKHLVFHPGTPFRIDLKHPRVDIQIIGNDVEGRFRTPEELRELYPGIELP